MPIIDKPLNELYRYNGISPCPEDIDKYWNSAIKEMNALDSNVELILSDFKSEVAECYDLYFTGTKDARIHAKFLKPKNKKSNPAVLQFHGYTGDCGDWNSKLNYVAAGFCVAALDCRGQGGLSEDVGGVKGNTHCGHIIRGLDDDNVDNLLYRQIFLDTAQLAGIIMDMPEVDKNRIGAMGGSQGGALAIACASLEPRIKKIVSKFPFLCDYKRVWEMDLTIHSYTELREFFRHFDPRHEREDEIFNKLGYIDIQNISKRIKGEVMMGTGLMDDYCPPSTQFAAYNKITSQKQVKIYPDFGHENLPGFDDIAYQFMMDL